MKRKYGANLLLISLIISAVLLSVVNASAYNVALNKPTSASSSYGEKTAAKGNDGDITTHWVASGYDGWWMVDLESPYAIDTISVFGQGSVSYTGLDFTIEYSLDNISWTLLGSAFVLAQPAWSKTFAVSGSPLMQYIKYNVNYGTTYQFPSWAYLGELQAFNSAPVPLPAAVWFLGSGLIGLWGWRRKKFKST